MANTTAIPNLVSKCGIIPDVSNVGYVIETKDVEKTFKEIFASREEKLRASGEYNSKYPVNVRVVTSALGSKKHFVPLLLVMDKSVLKNRGSRNSTINKNDDRIITQLVNNGNDRFQKVEMIEGFSDLIRPFLYDKEFVKAFASASSRRNNDNVSYSDAQAFQRVAMTPRLSRFQGENHESVLVVLDPMKVFFKMLGWDPNTNAYANRQYELEICVDDVKPTNTPYNYRYPIRRVFKKPNKKNNNGSGFVFMTGQNRR